MSTRRVYSLAYICIPVGCYVNKESVLSDIYLYTCGLLRHKKEGERSKLCEYGSVLSVCGSPLNYLHTCGLLCQQGGDLYAAGSVRATVSMMNTGECAPTMPGSPLKVAVSVFECSPLCLV